MERSKEVSTRKGGRVKAVWLATITRVGRALVPDTGIRIHVRVSLEREPDRDVSLYFTVDEAEKWGNALLHFAQKTRKDRGE